jgi:hypothetical protein
VDIDVTFMCRHVNDLLGLPSSPSCTLVVHEVEQEVKLDHADGAKRLRDLKLRVLILKDDFKEMDVKMEKMLKASEKKE